MKKYVWLMPKIVLLFSVFYSCTLNINAQNESGVRWLNDTTFKSAGFWYDSSNSMFQNAYPIIRSIPPLSTGMPYDIMYSYIYLDSLLRFTTNSQQDQLMSTWSSLNDTLKNAIKYLYKIVDYDPIIFNQYMGEVALHNSSVSGGRYQSSLFHLRNNVSYKLKSLVEPLKMNAFIALLLSDYILKIHVIAIDSVLDKRRLPGIESPDSKRYIVYATVLDTLKGKSFIDLNTGANPPVIPHSTQIALPSVTEPVISFQYQKLNYFQHPYSPNNPQSNIQNDVAFSDNNGGFKMTVGQDAVIFLRHTNQLFDFQNDYFDLDLESLCSNNALPIIGGNIRDINLFWSQNSLQSYEEWRTAVTLLIQQIINGTY